MQKINLETYCPICHQFHYVEVNERDFYAWQDGALAQDVFPYLSTNEREMLISGICPDCWGKMFGEEEEKDPENFEDEDWLADGYDEFECGKFIYDEMAANP